MLPSRGEVNYIIMIAEEANRKTADGEPESPTANDEMIV